MSPKPKTSSLTSPSDLLITPDRDNSDISPCLDHLYVPHARYLGKGLQCFGKGVMIRAGRATTSYLRKATLGAQAVAIVSKIWNIWDGFHKELYLYGHPLHLRPLQGLCVPNIIGVFNTSEGLANMAMEPPHPHAWRVADRSLSTNEKRVIVEAYAKIHARGVLHRDVALRHMLIGRDGKATIINFRQASCLPPVKRIGLSGCGAHDFQLEMRQVKFLLDYQGAREFEYRLAREHFCAMRTSSTAGITSSALFPISEPILQLWDANALEDLRPPPPPLPFYVPNSPNISVQPISWIPEEWPSSVDDLRHGGFAMQPPLLGPSPEISLTQDRSDLEGEDGPIQAPQLLRFSGRKRKIVERDGGLDVARDASSSKRICLGLHTTITTEERSPDPHYRRALSVSEESVHRITNSDLTPRPNSDRASCPAPDVTALSYLAIPSSVNTSVSQDHSSGDSSLEDPSSSPSLPCDENEPSLPESLTTSLEASSSRAPFPNHSASDARPQSAGSDAPFDPYVDNILDSSVDSSLTSDDSSCGSWAYLETLEPDSPTGAFVTLQAELFQTPNVDISNPLFILGFSSDVENDLSIHHRLECPRRSLEGCKTNFDKYKRKRLFIANEDDYEERPCKRRSIEQ
ncbi:hypothetical protein EI94DRAFT_103997 [Lactarius quietus]|nr:hypothetical protein EI94DRAFT_103997 [Lactarius quietus]